MEFLCVTLRLINAQSINIRRSMVQLEPNFDLTTLLNICDIATVCLNIVRVCDELFFNPSIRGNVRTMNI